MNGLTLFGLLAVTLMLVFYALEKQSHWFILALTAPRLSPISAPPRFSTVGALRALGLRKVVDTAWPTIRAPENRFARSPAAR